MSKSPPKKTNQSQAEQGVTARGDSDSKGFVLSEADAKAGGPADESVAGEEDPGAGLEFLIDSKRDKGDRA